MRTKEIERFLDAILGTDKDLDDDLASSILESEGIDEDTLTADFKTLLRARLAEVPDESKEAKHLERTLKQVIAFEKKSSPLLAKPKDYIGDLFRGVSGTFSKPVYSFHKRSDGEMPETDARILADLANELDEDDAEE